MNDIWNGLKFHQTTLLPNNIGMIVSSKDRRPMSVRVETYDPVTKQKVLFLEIPNDGSIVQTKGIVF